MIRITVQYGIDSVTRTFDQNVTIGELRRNHDIRGALSYGDNVKMKIGGMEMCDDVLIPNGSTVVVETAANTKAQP